MRTYFQKDAQVLKNLNKEFKETQRLIKEKEKYQYQPQEINLNDNFQQTKQVWELNIEDMLEGKCSLDEATINEQKKVEIDDSKKKIKNNIFKMSKFGSSNLQPQQNDEKSNKAIKKEIDNLIRQKKQESYQQWCKEQEEKKQQKKKEEQEEQEKKKEEEQEKKKEEEKEEGKEEAKEENDKIKNKKIKKIMKNQGQNYVKLDLKRKYQDKYRGGVYMNKKYYKANGKLKNQKEYKENQFGAIEKEGKVQYEISQQSKQGYRQISMTNIYLQSISENLRVNLYFNDGQDIQDEEQKEQLRHTKINKLVQEYWQQDKNPQVLKIILKEAFGHDYFREGQQEAIESIIKGESVLLVQKTGHGKSLVYQMLSLLFENGIGIVFTPLISLMIDQIQKLPQCVSGISYHSLLMSKQKQNLIELVKEKKVKLIFCTPEIFQKDLGFQINELGKVNFVCIDEAHSVSELSHNFRHTYLVLDQMIQQFLQDKPPYLATTATANYQTIASINNKFLIHKNFITHSTIRENLIITISRDKEINSALIKLLSQPPFIDHKSMIIYARSRYMVDSISNYLTQSGFNAAGLHAGLTDVEKITIQNKFMSSQTRILVSTSIFAMGIDKADVRAIIHVNLPKTMESYLQEIGRAGRDGLPSNCHLFLNENDYHKERSFIIADTPNLQTVDKLYNQMLRKCSTKKMNQKCEKRQKDQDIQQFEQMNEVNEQIFYLDSKYTEESLDTRKDNVYTQLRLIEKASKDKIKVYPICPEKGVLKFFQYSKEQLKEKNEFIASIMPSCKEKNGALEFNVISVANKLQLHPLDVIRKCKQLFQEFYITCETNTDIFPFQFKEIPEKEQILQEVYEESQKISQNSLAKLNILYLCAIQNSVPNYQYSLDIIKTNEVNNTITQMNRLLDIYFYSKQPNQEIFEFLYGNDFDHQAQLDELLPFNYLSEEKTILLLNVVNRFLQEEVIQINTKEERQKKLKVYLNDPKVLTRLLCGISSIQYDYKEWKNTIIWNAAGRYKFESVYQVIIEFLAVKKQNENRE